MPNTQTNLAAFIWSVADLLRGDFKQSQYGRIILPFTLLRRLECVLEPSKEAVLAQYEQVRKSNLPEDGSQGDIKDNLETCVQSFSRDAREIFEHFKFDEFVGTLNEANLLYKVVRKFATIDLSPKAISNHDMGLVQLSTKNHACNAFVIPAKEAVAKGLKA
ncbi:type I restriction-modification system subunit M N-terminal domain-containing protein [Endozoicomonas gorgoniicola]|uniref:Type I restriction-modification system subunit M N-terminal domain-containing protein n=1 Tax=Endozoicomonas gorgoniicola TaxID=1234144 RepID=A0ABT3MYV4_9GAMM|nr:type I restriction-modification system subunit M N-terminal domain-containing protein [Endozoicomonas gorgoniicola]MCW7554542.1 type I restriction-modification system subunit M N-terminal domain-containing protein [Endozoicomonas gorgoniicola]